MEPNTHKNQRTFRTIVYACGMCLIVLLSAAEHVSSQEFNTYTLDNDFDTGELFRHIYGINDLIKEEDGRYMAVGYFDPVDGPFRYSGRIFSDGAADLSWSSPLFSSGYLQIAPFFENRYLIINVGGEYLNDFTSNGEVIYTTENNTPPIDFHMSYIYGPYLIPIEPEKVTNFRVLNNNKVLVCGRSAIGPQAYLMGLMRLHPDGILDQTFPILECDPNSINSDAHTTDIIKAPGGKWYLSGSFNGINGYFSPNIVRLNPNFTVDTTFTSPFAAPESMGVESVSAKYADSQGRVWVAGEEAQLEQTGGEATFLTRLLPNGDVDTAFSPPSLAIDEALTSDDDAEIPGIAGVAPLNGHYLVYGEFATYNETGRKCIAMIDESGQLVEGYFEDLGADSCRYFNQVRHPRIGDVLIEGDGTLVVGGAFSSFGGEEHYNMVKLQPESVGLEETYGHKPFRVYPNPAAEEAWIKWDGPDKPIGLRIYNATGQLVEMMPATTRNGKQRIDLSGFNPGMYFIGLRGPNRNYALKKLVVR